MLLILQAYNTEVRFGWGGDNLLEERLMDVTLDFPDTVTKWIKIVWGN